MLQQASILHELITSDDIKEHMKFIGFDPQETNYKVQCFEKIKLLYETADQKIDDNLRLKCTIESIIFKTPDAELTAEEIDKAIGVETIPDRKKRGPKQAIN